jgi:hypothetical protein
MDSSRYAPRRSTLPRFAPGGLKILLEVLVRTPRLQVAEVPFEFAERHAGKSKASAREMARYLRQLVVLRIATADRPGLARSTQTLKVAEYHAPDDTETLAAASGRRYGRAGPIVGGAQARCGRVNFFVHSPQVSHVSARAIGRPADLPRYGPHPAHRHCQRCYGPLPFRH